MQYGDQEAWDGLDDPVTRLVIGCAIAVHRKIGPGLLESAYQVCLAHELRKADVKFSREVPVPVRYDDIQLECGYRLDFLVEESVILEVKCVESVQDIHLAQLMTYLRLTGKERGLIINFNTVLLKNGIFRRVLTGGRSARPIGSNHSSLTSATTASLR